MRGFRNQGIHLLHLQQLSFLLPKPQLLQKQTGILLLPIHFPHLQQLSFLLPEPQLLQRQAGILLLPIHFPHLQQLSFLLPEPQLLQRLAGYFVISNLYNPLASIKIIMAWDQNWIYTDMFQLYSDREYQ